MPKVKYLNCSGESAFKADMIEMHGNLASIAAVGRMLGYKSYQAIYNWLNDNGISEFEINGRRRYSVPEIATAIWRSRV